MPIHLRAYKNRDEVFNLDATWVISDLEIEHLGKVFENYKKRTGIYIEEYSDTFIAQGCSKPLQDAIIEILHNEDDKNTQATLRKLLETAQQTEKNNEGLAFIGE